MSSIRVITALLTLAGATILAYQPLVWLTRSWYLPGYPSNGPWVVALVIGLLLWSVSSRRLQLPKGNVRYLGFGLLAASALLRTLAQVWDINLLAATVLAVDVYAIGMLLGVAQRQRRLSPLWLAALFCFALPVEPWLQRLFGAPLQWLSAQGACGLLGWYGDNLQCDGVRLQLSGVEVLVDLPCSGSQLLTQAGLLFCFLQCVATLRVWQAGATLVLTAISVWLANALRISLLALGIAHPPWQVDVMAAPWHELIGLMSFSLVAFVVIRAFMRGRASGMTLNGRPRFKVGFDVDIGAKDASSGHLEPMANRDAKVWQRGQLLAPVAASLFLLLTGVVVDLQPQPIDRTPLLDAPYAPANLATERRRSVALSAQEQAYYRTYGGNASKSAYGPFGLLLVRTAAPLRHLHAPDLCLSGMGYAVQFLTTEYSPVPTAVYVATNQRTQSRWQVRVSYQSSSGAVVASVSDLVWQWIRAPEHKWTMVQRLVPMANASLRGTLAGKPTLTPAALAWERAVVRAYNLGKPPAPQPIHNPTTDALLMASGNLDHLRSPNDEEANDADIM